MIAFAGIHILRSIAYILPIHYTYIIILPLFYTLYIIYTHVLYSWFPYPLRSPCYNCIFFENILQFTCILILGIVNLIHI